jgi:hypothetical protein
MKKLITCLMVCLFKASFAQNAVAPNFKINVHKFDGAELCHRLTCDDSAAVINLIEEEGTDSAFVMKLSETKMMVTMKCEEYEVQYILHSRYIDKVVIYYPNKTLFYDKDFKPYKPKTSN